MMQGSKLPPVTMISIRWIHDMYNVKHRLDAEHLEWMRNDIGGAGQKRGRGLEKPIKVNQGSKRNWFDLIGGWGRIQAVQALHRAKPPKSIYCLVNGQVIPKGKIAAYIFNMPPKQAWLEAVLDNMHRDTALSIMEFGAHFDKMIATLGYGEKEGFKQEIADGIHMSVDWVKKCLTAWRGIKDEKMRLEMIGGKARTFKTRHLLAIGRLQTPQAQRVVADRIVKKNLNVEEAEDLVKALSAVENAVPPTSKKEAERLIERVERQRASIQPGTMFIQIMDLPFVRDTVKKPTVNFLRIPNVKFSYHGEPYVCNREIQYIPCIGGFFKEEELKKQYPECLECPSRTTHFKVAHMQASLSLAALEEDFNEALNRYIQRNSAKAASTTR